jgi:hypothetical protein
MVASIKATGSEGDIRGLANIRHETVHDMMVSGSLGNIMGKAPSSGPMVPHTPELGVFAAKTAMAYSKEQTG